MDEKTYIKRAYEKINKSFSELVNELKKGKLTDEMVDKTDSTITIYYEVFKRNTDKLEEQVK